jgi:hypothetical protein
MMPDPALEATERQFFRLVGHSNQIAQFYLHPFTLPSIKRGEKTQAHINQYYQSFEREVHQNAYSRHSLKDGAGLTLGVETRPSIFYQWLDAFVHSEIPAQRVLLNNLRWQIFPNNLSAKP